MKSYRRSERGQAMIEALIVIPLGFFFILAGLDLQLALQDLGAMQHAATQTAICVANANPACSDPAQFARQQVAGIGFMDSSQMTVTVVAGPPATVTLQYGFAPIGPLLKPVTLTRIASAVKPS